MNTKIIGLALIVISLGLGYYGINKVNSGSNSIEIGDIELSADNEGKKTTGYLMIGGAVILLIGGGVLMKKSN